MLLSKLNKIFSFYKTSTHTIYCIFGIKCKIPKKGNNRLIVVDPDGSRKTVSHIKGCKVKFKGSNAEVIIHRPYKFSNCTVTCYSNTKFEINASSQGICGLNVVCNKINNQVIIGSNFSCTDNCKILNTCEPGCKIIIGDDCMFATDIYIRNNDGHTIIDRNSGKVINHPKDVIIGNHVWLGYNVTVLKGAVIPDGCVVGAGSIVSKPLTEPNSIYAGQPAKLIKSNIQWFRETICNYLKLHPEGQ